MKEEKEMKLRLAEEEDLIFLKEMYKKVVTNMYENDIKIWDEYYPAEVLHEDIENKTLYVLENDKEIVAASALFESLEEESSVNWSAEAKDALYIGKLAVNVDYLRQGISSVLIEKLKEKAIEKNKNYLRLFVVNNNIPAIKCYEKNGFTKVDGIHEEKIDDELILSEFGFEMCAEIKLD